MKDRNIINDNSDTLKKYFKDVNKTNLLSVAEENDLAIRIQNGDTSAIEKLVNGNLKFVVKVAKEYQGLGVDLPDLISDGNLGLIKAAERFDPSRGFKFISYAVWWIKQSIIQGLNDNSRTIRLPSNVISKIYQLNKTVEIDAATREKVYPVCISLNSKVSDNGGEIIDFICDDSLENDLLPYEEITLKKAIDKALKVLTKRERGIIEYYFGLNKDYEAMTLEDIGDKYDLSKERIRQIKEKAIRRLRHNNEELFSLLNH